MSRDTRQEPKVPNQKGKASGWFWTVRIQFDTNSNWPSSILPKCKSCDYNTDTKPSSFQSHWTRPNPYVICTPINTILALIPAVNNDLKNPPRKYTSSCTPQKRNQIRIMARENNCRDQQNIGNQRHHVLNMWQVVAFHDVMWSNTTRGCLSFSFRFLRFLFSALNRWILEVCRLGTDFDGISGSQWVGAKGWAELLLSQF